MVVGRYKIVRLRLRLADSTEKLTIAAQPPDILVRYSQVDAIAAAAAHRIISNYFTILSGKRQVCNFKGFNESELRQRSQGTTTLDVRGPTPSRYMSSEMYLARV